MVKRRTSVYAVAKGRRPGLYHDWNLCNDQVRGFPCARFKGFSNVDEAQQFMRLHGVEHHADFVDTAKKIPAANPQVLRIQADESSSPPSSSFKQRWDGIAASQNLVPGSQAWRVWSRDRTVAGSQRLRELFFDGRLELQGFQALCRRVGIASPADTIHNCRADIKSKLVNIYDLIDAVESNTTVPVWPSEKWKDFKKYTLDEQNCYNLGIAKRSSILSCFLQDLNSRGPRPTDGHSMLTSDKTLVGLGSHGGSDVDADTLHNTSYTPAKALKRRQSLETSAPGQMPAPKRWRLQTNNNSQYNPAPLVSLEHDSREISASNSKQVVIEIEDSSSESRPSPPPKHIQMESLIFTGKLVDTSSPPPSAQAPVDYESD